MCEFPGLTRCTQEKQTKQSRRVSMRFIYLFMRNNTTIESKQDLFVSIQPQRPCKMTYELVFYLATNGYFKPTRTQKDPWSWLKTRTLNVSWVWKRNDGSSPMSELHASRPTRRPPSRGFTVSEREVAPAARHYLHSQHGLLENTLRRVTLGNGYQSSGGLLNTWTTTSGFWYQASGTG